MTAFGASFINPVKKRRERKGGRERRKITTIYFKWQILMDQLSGPLFPVSWMSDDLRLVFLNILSITIHLCKLLSHVLIIHPFSVNCRLFLINEAGWGRLTWHPRHSLPHPGNLQTRGSVAGPLGGSWRTWRTAKTDEGGTFLHRPSAPMVLLNPQKSLFIWVKVSYSLLCWVPKNWFSFLLISYGCQTLLQPALPRFKRSCGPTDRPLFIWKIH